MFVLFFQFSKVYMIIWRLNFLQNFYINFCVNPFYLYENFYLNKIKFQEMNLNKNQKLGLTFALLEEGAWSLAKQLLDRFPEFFAVNASFVFIF